MNIEVIPLWESPEHSDTCARWAYDEWYGDRDISLNVIKLDYSSRAVKRCSDVTLIAGFEKKIIGMVTIKEKSLSNFLDLGPWIVSLYVLPEFRERGAASRLIKEAEDYSAKKGTEMLFVYLARKRRTMLDKFYRRLGWRYFCSGLDNDGFMTGIYVKKIYSI